MAGVVIKDLLPQPKNILIGGDKYLSVRGLRMDETVKLLAKYREPLARFFGHQNLDFELLLVDAPQMCSEVIACGAEAVGQEEDILRLPLQTQVEALMAIWELSVPDLKNLLASLAKASDSLQVAREGVLQP